MTMMMMCGHAAQGHNHHGAPVCVVCSPKIEGQIVDVRSLPLAGRVARCHCGKEVASSTELAFFEYRGPGSTASRSCRNCRFAEIAHTPDATYVNSNRRNPNICAHYEPMDEGWPTDIFYDGCRGWD